MNFRWFFIVVSIIGFVGCVAFIAQYWVKAGNEWMKAEAGRFFMGVYSNLAALFLYVIIGNLYPTWEGRIWGWVILYSIFAIEAWWPLRLLVDAQKDAKKKKVSR
jgi:hypothetical protein